MLSTAKKAWQVTLALVLAFAMCLPTAAFALDGQGDTSTSSDGTMSVYVQDSEGDTALLKEYTAEEFAALATDVNAGYQYGTNVLAIAKMVTFDTLISDAGGSSYWHEGSSLQYTCTDGVYTKFQPTYEQLQQTGYFYPERSESDTATTEGAVEVPSGIAIPGYHTSSSLSGSLASDVLTNLLSTISGGNGDDGTKVGIGIMENVSDGSTLNAGWRLTGNVYSITIMTDDDVPSESADAITVNVQDPDGNSVELKGYSDDEIAALGTEVNAGYQYTRQGAVNLLAVSDMVTFDDLFSDAGASAYWTEGSYIQYTCTDGVYTGSQPTYAQLQETGYFYPDRSNTDLESTANAIEVPAGLALSGKYTRVTTSGETSADALAAGLATVASGGGDEGLRAVTGITSELSAGNRLASGVTAVTVMTDESLYSLKYCTVEDIEVQLYTGEAITPVTVTAADGTELVEGTDYTIQYQNNVNAGTATYTVTGAGKYSGTLTGEFEITGTALTVQLNGTTVKTYTSDELSSLLNTDTQYYLQANHGSVRVYAATNYVTFDDLIADAGLSGSWRDGSYIQYVCTDGVYSKDTPTYDDINTQIYTYPNQSDTDTKNTTDATQVPAILAFSYGSANTSGVIASDAYAAAAANMSETSFGKVLRGWAPDSEGNISAPGWRLATGVLTINIVTDEATEGFGDIDYSNPDASYAYAIDGINYVSWQGLMTGYSDTSDFGVGQTLTRAELAVMLWRYAEPEAAASYDAASTTNTSGKSDVEAGQWYTAAANWAVENHVINGYEGTDLFGTNDEVTFEQMVSILANYLAEDGAVEAANTDAMKAAFTDSANISDWALKNMAWGYEQGVWSGYDNGDGTKTIAAGEDVLRERAAAVLYNLYSMGMLTVK